MSIDDIVRIVGLVVASFGGGAVIVIALSKWLGDVFAARILQREQAKLDAHIEAIRHELGLAKSAYERHLDLILEYYALFYSHYRRCQKTAYVDAHRQLPDGEMKYTRDEFIEALADFLVDWAAKEGKIRLLLPSSLLAIHERAVSKFNEFKRAVHEFTPAEPAPRRKEQIFRELEEIKKELEAGLREFFRTERLLK